MWNGIFRLENFIAAKIGIYNSFKATLTPDQLLKLALNTPIKKKNKFLTVIQNC